MCTVVVLRRPGDSWPLIMAANRDELLDRPWRAPARHWPDRPEVVAGMDELAGGSWLGVNDHGVAAAILNRRHSLGPAPDKRSRGELVLDALDHADASAAAGALAEIDGRAYRPFNMIVADNSAAFWIRNIGDRGPAGVQVVPVGAGVSMLTAWDLNDAAASDRTRLYLPRFHEATPPRPEADDWGDWAALLASRERAPGADDPNAAMHVDTGWGFGTVSSSLIALPAAGKGAKPRWLFASTVPERAPFRPVAL
ncbi:MAG: NRDE family protein [Alphaproteobacteria bacterium]